MSCPECHRTHFTVSKIRRALIDPSLEVLDIADRGRLDLGWIADQTGVDLTRGLNPSRDGFYFFLDCRYLNFEGKCPFGPHQVKGNQALTHVATVRSGEMVSLTVCNQDLMSTGYEPVAKFVQIPQHLVPLDDFISAYELLAPDEFTPLCIEHVKEAWPTT